MAVATLTEFDLNLLNPGASRDVFDRYSMHQTVDRITEDCPGRTLWLLRSAGTHARLVVQTETPVPEEAVTAPLRSGYALRGRQRSPSLTHAPGTVLHFYLEANAVRRKRVGKKDIVRPATETGDQLSWLSGRLESTGAKLVTGEVMNSHTHTIRPSDYKLFTVTYQGLLQIENPRAVSKLLQKGLGRKKYLGCGLLLAKPIELGLKL